MNEDDYSYLESIPEEKAMIQKLYEIFGQLRSIKKTADKMNKLGYRTKAGSKFNASTTRLLLKNPVYCIADENALQPLDSAIHENLKETCTRILSSLTPREERVLRMRFGIGMNTDHTLEEVGQQFNVTRERIRQIEAKALRKLKHPSRSRKLRSFLDS